MFLNQIIINFNDGTDVLKLKRDLKFLLLKNQRLRPNNKLEIVPAK